MKNLLIKSGLLMFVLALVLPAFSVAADSGPDLFATKCAACHGKDGSANTAMGKNMKIRDLGSADVQKMSDKEIEGHRLEGQAAQDARLRQQAQRYPDQRPGEVHPQFEEVVGVEESVVPPKRPVARATGRACFNRLSSIDNRHWFSARY